MKGNSFCGKTNVGKNIANVFYQKGYSYFETNLIDEARSFLNKNLKEDRICFLDDPFGFTYNSIKSREEYKKTYDLIKSLQLGRKLIITCNNEVEKRVNDGTYLMKWNDLTVVDEKFALDVWNSIVIKKNIALDISKKISDIIKNCLPQELLQPGQLDFIGNRWQDISYLSSDEIKQFASIDARRISDKIENSGNIRVYTVLGLLCSTISMVSLKDLQFIFSSNVELKGFLNKDPSEMGTFLIGESFGDEQDVLFPIYEDISPDKMEIKIGNELDYFEKQGYINYTEESYVFGHPVYNQAAFILIKELPTNKFDTLIKDLMKSIAVLNVQSSLNAVRKLSFIYKCCKSKRQKDDVLDIAKKSCLSIFPSVQDAAFTFLLSVIKDLDVDLLEFVKSKLSDSERDNSSIFWHNGIPFISGQQINGYSRYIKRAEIVNTDLYFKLISQIESDQNAMPAEKAWQIANFIKKQSMKHPYKVSEKVLYKLMDFDESFIREIGAFHIMYAFKEPPLYLIEKVFSDNHPFVVFQGLKGSFRGWPLYSLKCRKVVFKYLKMAMRKEDIVLRAKNLMTQFGIGYSSYSFDWRDHIQPEQQKDMWSLWAKLMPFFFMRIPSIISLDSNRFISTIKTSSEYLNSVEKFLITRSWLHWLNRYFKDRYHYDDALFYVTDYFFDIERNIKINKSDFINKLINNQYLQFRCYNIRKFIEEWENLNDEERKIVEISITSKSKNIEQAVALTSAMVPKEIEFLITSRNDFFRQTALQIKTTLDLKLLHACLIVVFGNDSVSYLLFKNGDFWKEVLRCYLTDLEMPFSKLAIKQLIDECLMQDLEEHSFNIDTFKLFKKVIKAENSDLNYFIRSLLLEELAVTTQSGALELWKIFLQNVTSKFKEETTSQILNNIEPIDESDNLGIFYNLVKLNFFKEPLLREDDSIWMLIEYFESISEENKKENKNILELLVGIIEHCNQQKDILLSITVKKSMRLVEIFEPIDKTLLDRLEMVRLNLHYAAKNKRQQLRDELNKELSIFNFDNRFYL